MSRIKFDRKFFIYILIACILVLIGLACAFINGKTISANAMTNNSVIIEGDFEEDNVIVVLDNNVEFDEHYFNCIDVETINDLSIRNTDETGDKRILQIYLKEKSKENVLHAVDQLNKLDKSINAEPNYICTPADEPNDTYYLKGDLWGLKRYLLFKG